MTSSDSQHTIYSAYALALRRKIIDGLEHQGYQICDGKLIPPDISSKDAIRSLHAAAVEHKLERSERRLASKEPRLLKWIADGDEIDPATISPALVPVRPGTEEELVFRWASLHWSIPVSSGYGRRLRMLVVDRSNGKLIGLIGLGDPVFNIGARDQWIGWDPETKKRRIRSVMDAFVLGAVPPYSNLLMGKFVASAAVSDETKGMFESHYAGTVSRISGTTTDGRLALLTTTSALGRSSLYSRLRYRDVRLFEPIGFTRGAGELHFSNGLSSAIQSYAMKYCSPTYRHPLWGTGFRNRREVVKKTLASVGLSTDWAYHGVQRQVFAAPAAENALSYLCGTDDRIVPRSLPLSGLWDWHRERWLLPRASRDQSFRTFKAEDWRLWPG